eukprot:TRINITY_DN81010_c0_g1_i1.p4 TRINITY_DN81010_c0_g1~~TRINITY_DN81010_c0_g1_i1.p4  ORF type:complete len:122 (+),score=0.69 TRINITY_DN81010_c0_g1_i1:349-714(+)
MFYAATKPVMGHRLKQCRKYTCRELFWARITFARYRHAFFILVLMLPLLFVPRYGLHVSASRAMYMTAVCFCGAALTFCVCKEENVDCAVYQIPQSLVPVSIASYLCASVTVFACSVFLAL